MVEQSFKTGGRGHRAATAVRRLPLTWNSFLDRCGPRAATAFFLLWLFQSVPASGETPPGFLWARSAGGGSDDEARAVAVDSIGNVLVTGFFTGTNSFGGTNLVSSGLEDIFVAKYDAGGDFLWARQAGGIGYDEGRGIASDASGDIYVTGFFQNSARFGATNITSSGQSDAFIAKYDKDGNLIWVRGAGGNDFDEAHAIAVDGQGNAYITGYFDATATFGSFTLPNHSSSDDIFVAKCSSTGNFLWARQAGGSLDDVGNGIALDGATNVYVTGFFSGTSAFGITNLTSPGAGGLPDVFVAKYDSEGNGIWVRQAGGTNDDEGSAVAADPAGNVSLAGKFFGVAGFGNTHLTGNGMDIFVARYDTAGNLLWVRGAGGNNAIYGDAGLGVAVDAGSNTFVTGYFSGNATFGNTNLASAGFDDVFCSKYDSAGNLLWVCAVGGTDLDLSYGLAADAQGNAYLAGFFASTVIAFDGATLTNRGGRDSFVAKLGLSVAPALNIAASNNYVVLYWPATYTDFVLESSAELPATKWAPITTGINVVGSSREITLPMSETQNFFRLRKQ